MYSIIKLVGKDSLNIMQYFVYFTQLHVGSGCGSLEREVASATRSPWFESNRQQKFIIKIFIVYFKGVENIEKEAGNGPFLNMRLNVFIFSHFLYPYYIYVLGTYICTYMYTLGTFICNYMYVLSICIYV